MDHMIDDAERPLPMPPEGHPLHRLGKRLTELLDEDHWAECEQLLLEGWEHDRIDRKTGADWRINSSLEVWFPITANNLKPMTNDDITRLVEEFYCGRHARNNTPEAIVRAVEAAHGIYVDKITTGAGAGE